jgi:hypothetical protein
MCGVELPGDFNKHTTIVLDNITLEDASAETGWQEDDDSGVFAFRRNPSDAVAPVGMRLGK